MLLGTYSYSVDEKGRMRMPQKLKSQLGDNFVVTKGSSGCLFVFSQESLKECIYDKLKDLPLSNVEAQKPLRLILSSAFEVEEDSAGRFILPSILREFASITKNIVIIGVGSHCEIWSEERWNEYNESMLSFDDNFAMLSQFSI